MTPHYDDDLLDDLPRGRPGRPDQIAEARWATPAELDASWDYHGRSGQALLLGYAGGRGVGRTDDRHIVTVAGSRSGKGRSLIIPNLLLYRGSVLAIDPKGELARVTKRAREQKLGQRCVVLDPFGANGRHPTGSFNPLSELDPASPEVIDDVALIADALIIDDGASDKHWTESAKLLLRGLILFALTFTAAERNLVTVRKLLMLSHPQLKAAGAGKEAEIELILFNAMAGQENAFNGVLAEAGRAFLNMGPRERASVISSARTQTAFLDSPPLQTVLKASDFRLRDLKREKLTIYLCLPASRMATHYKWLRVMINLAMTVFEREPVIPSPPVLMVLEEFPVLDHMRAIEVAAGQIAGFGVKLWTILQDLTQIQRLYRESWETFIGNAGIVTFFGNSDATTLDYVSRKLGTMGMRIEMPSGATPGALLGGARLTSEQLRVDPLLAPHEFERLFARETQRLLVLSPGWPPVVLRRALYDRDPAFKGDFDGP